MAKHRRGASSVDGFTLPGAPLPQAVGRTIVGCRFKIEVDRLTKPDRNIIKGFAARIFQARPAVRHIEFFVVFTGKGRLRVVATQPATPGAKPLKQARRATKGLDGDLTCYRIKGGFRQFRANDAVGLRARCDSALVTAATARRLGLLIP